MDYLTFIASIVDSLAWPIVLLGMVYIFRIKLSEILSRVTRIKHNETEIDFSQEVADVSEEAKEALPEPTTATEPSNKKSQQLAELSPRGAILESWLEVEDAVYRLAQRYDVSLSDKKSMNVQFLKLGLSDNDPLGKGTYEMLDRLRHLRNEAVHLHDKDIDPLTAVEYSELANRVVRVLDEA